MCSGRFGFALLVEDGVGDKHGNRRADQTEQEVADAERRAEQPVAHFVAVQQPGYQTDYRDKAVAEQKSQVRGKTK